MKSAKSFSVVLERYELPPQCDVFVMGNDVQSDLGQKVCCSNRATAKVDNFGFVTNVCEEHLSLIINRPTTECKKRPATYCERIMVNAIRAKETAEAGGNDE